MCVVVDYSKIIAALGSSNRKLLSTGLLSSWLPGLKVLYNTIFFWNRLNYIKKCWLQASRFGQSCLFCLSIYLSTYLSICVSVSIVCQISNTEAGVRHSPRMNLNLSKLQDSFLWPSSLSTKHMALYRHNVHKERKKNLGLKKSIDTRTCTGSHT